MTRILGILALCFLAIGTSEAKEVTLLNVSYDPTRELFEEINPAFAKSWEAQTGQKVRIKQSHGGSGKQARAVIDGLPADVVTLALAYDVEALAEKGKLIPADWQKRLPHNSAPFTSTIVFLVREGKKIEDWGDLVKPGVNVITPNPKTSGGARWNYLAAWGWALRKYDGNEAKAKEYMRQLFKNVSVLDSGARGSTVTFVQRGVGDVLIAWESEALSAVKEYRAEKFRVVVPSVSILAEPTIAVVDRVVDRKGTREVAEAYLKFLYTPEAQEIGVKNFYRPSAQVGGDKFPKLRLFTIEEIGGWQAAHKKHFVAGGVFDEIMRP